MRTVVSTLAPTGVSTGLGGSGSGGAFADGLDGPEGMLLHEGIGVLGRLLQLGQCFGVGGIAKGNADVAEEAGLFAAPQRGMAEALAKSVCIEAKQVQQVEVLEFGQGDFTHEPALPGKAVPWTDLETVITTENAVANGRPQVFRDGALQFDGEVADAASGIQLERGSDGMGGAGVDAARAAATAVGFGRVGSEFKGRKNLGNEEPVAKPTADQVGVFADKAEAGFLTKRTFEDRPGIDIGACSCAGASELLDVLLQLPKGSGQRIVVVGGLGVACNATGESVSRFRWLGRGIAGCEGDDGAGSVEHELGIRPAVEIAFQVGHGPVATGLDPFLVLLKRRRRAGGGEPAGIEAQVDGALANLFFQDLQPAVGC